MGKHVGSGNEDVMKVLAMEAEIQRLLDYGRILERLYDRIQGLILTNDQKMDDINAEIDTIIEASMENKGD